MGERTYAEMKADLTLELGQRTDLTSAPLSAGDWINVAYLTLTTSNQFFGFKLPKYFRFPELDTTSSATTVAGTDHVATPADALIVYTIHDTTNDTKLSGIRFREFVEKTGRATTASRSKPLYWQRYGANLKLYPTPDAAYALTIFYRKRPAELSGASDVTILGAEWDEVILKLAVIQSMMRLKQYDTADVEKKALMELMAGKVDIYDREQRDLKKYFAPDLVYLTYGTSKNR